MQFQALISFFFAYIAFVQAAPVQLPTGTPINGVEIPEVAVPNAVRDLGAVSAPLDVEGLVGQAGKVSTPVEVPVVPRSEPTATGHGRLPEVVPVTDEKTILAGLPETGVNTIVRKRQDLKLDEVPAGDAINTVSQLPGAVVEDVSSAGRRQLDSVSPDDLVIPTIPTLHDVAERQLQTPDVPNASTVEGAPVAPIPPILDSEVPAVTPAITPPVEVRQVDVPDLASVGENLPPAPGLNKVVERQADILPAVVPAPAFPSVDTISPSLVPEAKTDDADIILEVVPSLETRRVAVGEPIVGLPAPEVTTPFTPLLPTN
ncbi:hypothetical protein BKA70DRAFT_1510229 [Coprinopsis sp. MPI-PUGE-AT-0042]|nr:hypothetical protein BKA70DRAFT_1510229 [Coprinopsis sp. MPI-PUGE-AT-0042]